MRGKVRNRNNTMAEQNVPAQAPTRTDEQIISVDILRNTNFFRAFSASASVPAIYIQQFWNSMKYDEKTGALDKLLRPSSPRTVMGRVYSRDSDILLTQGNDGIIKRPESPCHLPGDDFLLASKQPEPATKRAPPKKPTTTTPVKPTKPPSSKQPKSPTKKPSKRKPPQKVRKGKPSFQLVDEDDEAQQEPVPQGEGDEPLSELAKKMSFGCASRKGEGECADADIERAIKLSLDPSFLPQGRAPVGGVTIRDLVSETTPKLPEVVGKGKAIVTEEQVAHSLIDLSKKKKNYGSVYPVRRDQAPHDSTTGPSSQLKMIHQRKTVAPKGNKKNKVKYSSTVTSGVGISVRTEDQARSDPGKAHEALAGPDPEPMQEDHIEMRLWKNNPESHSGSMLSMKNLEDTDKFRDQFLNDKQTEDEQEKSKVVTTPPITTEATSITTTLLEITPFIALQLRVAKLEQDMSEVKKTDHSAAALASIKSQVPTVVDKYLGTKLDDALLRILERHTADLIENLLLVKDHKRKHDSDDDEDDDDNEGPSAGSNQGKSTKWRRHDSGTSGSEPESRHSEHSSDDVSKQDEGHVSDLEDTDNAHIPKEEKTTGKSNATTYQVPAENKLQRKTYSFIKWFCRRTGKKKLCKADLEGPAFNLVKSFHKNNIFLQFQMDEYHKLLMNKVDLVNPEGHQILRNIYEPLPLGGPPGQVTIQPQFFFNKDLEYLLIGDKERKTALSISKLKAARYLDFGLEELVPSLWVESERDYDISAAYEDYTIVPKPRAVIYKDINDQRKLMRLNEIHKFSDGTLTRVMEKLDHMVKDFHLFEYNKGMETRKWSEDDKRRSKDFITAIEKRL
ncbi:hypothetical protein Tco_1311463 [Tanacetum coccineum]